MRIQSWLNWFTLMLINWLHAWEQSTIGLTSPLLIICVLVILSGWRHSLVTFLAFHNKFVQLLLPIFRLDLIYKCLKILCIRVTSTDYSIATGQLILRKYITVTILPLARFYLNLWSTQFLLMITLTQSIMAFVPIRAQVAWCFSAKRRVHWFFSRLRNHNLLQVVVVACCLATKVDFLMLEQVDYALFVEVVMATTPCLFAKSTGLDSCGRNACS